jgi:hypothetical protein
MGNIKKVTRGALAKTRKQNEIIAKVNAIENMTVRAATDEEAPRLLVSDNGSELVVPGGSGGGGGGGGGLPEYPGDAPSDNVKAPLVWDGDNGAARWLQGETQDPADTNDYIDVFSYDPLPAFDQFALTRFELRDGVICENGSRINVKIMLIRSNSIYILWIGS